MYRPTRAAAASFARRRAPCLPASSARTWTNQSRARARWLAGAGNLKERNERRQKHSLDRRRARRERIRQKLAHEARAPGRAAAAARAVGSQTRVRSIRSIDELARGAR